MSSGQAALDRLGNDSIVGEWVLNDETIPAKDILRVARTVDLEASDEIKVLHIAEAVGYRSLDRSVWI